MSFEALSEYMLTDRCMDANDNTHAPPSPIHLLPQNSTEIINNG